jgi:hypothetical protein
MNIAPCGMNCSLCLGYIRDKNRCLGCNGPDDKKPYHCSACSIKLCDRQTGFCFSCEKYPCRRLKDLDKRYRMKYGMSMIENLCNIKNNGIDKFIEDDTLKWTCSHCGKLLCVHRDECPYCKAKNTRYGPGGDFYTDKKAF